MIDLATGELALFAPDPSYADKMLISPDGKYFIKASVNGLWVYDMAKQTLAAELPCDAPPNKVVEGLTFFTPDSRFLIMWSTGIRVRKRQSAATAGWPPSHMIRSRHWK